MLVVISSEAQKKRKIYHKMGCIYAERIKFQNRLEIKVEQAEKEVKDLRKRTAEGIETARQNGKQIGGVKGATLNIKKKAPAKEIILKHSKDFYGTLSDSEVIKLAGLSRNTYYKYKKELKLDT